MFSDQEQLICYQRSSHKVRYLFRTQSSSRRPFSSPWGLWLDRKFWWM